jgi:anti-sigma-K factor RskA
VPSEGRISAAAVTEEPAGGSPQPTTPILLVGTLAKS